MKKKNLFFSLCYPRGTQKFNRLASYSYHIYLSEELCYKIKLKEKILNYEHFVRSYDHFVRNYEHFVRNNEHFARNYEHFVRNYEHFVRNYKQIV